MRSCRVAIVLCITVVVGSLVPAQLTVAARRPSSALPLPPSILVSRQLMESQHLAVGDVVPLSTDAGGRDAREFRIAGVYEPTPDPMRLGAARHEVRMHLPDLIDMTVESASEPAAAETVDALNVTMADRTAADELIRRMASAIPGVSAHSTTGGDSRAAPFVVLERFHLAIAVVTVIASSIFLLALMLMLVDERRSTVGILRLIGFRRRRILEYVFAEGVVIAAAGAVFGIALAAIFQGAINRFFQWRYDTALVFVRVTPAVAIKSIAIGVPLGIAAAVASSWTLLRREVFTLTRR
jgi:putative ABC transport system permease protein